MYALTYQTGRSHSRQEVTITLYWSHIGISDVQMFENFGLIDLIQNQPHYSKIRKKMQILTVTSN